MDKIKIGHFELRLVNEEDAEFIVLLRNDPALSKHLNKTEPDIDAQRAWIADYKQREAQSLEFYFVAQSPNGHPIGLTRLYNFSGNTFTLGSWIFRRGLPESVAVLADLATRDFAFESLGYRVCAFEVRKENKSVMRYHRLFRPKQVGESTENIYFELDYETYLQSKTKILKLFNYG